MQPAFVSISEALSENDSDGTQTEQKLADRQVKRQREDIQMVALFVVIVVLGRLRAGAPQPPDGVARRHQPREAVSSHSRERYARILTPRSTSRARLATARLTATPAQCSPYDQETRGTDQQVSE